MVTTTYLWIGKLFSRWLKPNALRSQDSKTSRLQNLDKKNDFWIQILYQNQFDQCYSKDHGSEILK